MQKISAEQVLEIYEKHFLGVSNLVLASEYNLSPSTICNILKGKDWVWLYDRYLELKTKYKDR